MNIVLCLKQVPDVDDIKWTKDNNLDRALMLSKLNPCDEQAIDYAVNIKSKFTNVKITAISMGPNQAKSILDYALAKGADRAILLSDKAFAASDTLATSKILACAIKKYIPDFDIIFTGQMAQDGDTAQVPVSLAQCLDVAEITNVSEIVNADSTVVIAQQTIDFKINVFEVKTPCLVAINGECKEHYEPKINDYIRAQNSFVEVYNAQDLEIDKNEIGILGSPTMVYKVFRPQIKKEAKEVNESQAKCILENIYRING